MNKLSARKTMLNRLKPWCHCRQQGMSLIEALVTIVLLGVALLGMAMMHAQSFKFTTAAYARTQANILSEQIMDRMRAIVMDVSVSDPSTALQGYKHTGAPSGGWADCDFDPDPSDPVLNDLYCWHAHLENSMPVGTTTDIISLDNVVYTISISWTEEETRQAGGNQSAVVFNFQPLLVPPAS